MARHCSGPGLGRASAQAAVSQLPALDSHVSEGLADATESRHSRPGRRARQGRERTITMVNAYMTVASTVLDNSDDFNETSVMSYLDNAPNALATVTQLEETDRRTAESSTSPRLSRCKNSPHPRRLLSFSLLHILRRH